MTRAAAIADLFGHVPQSGELGLAEPPRGPKPIVKGGVTLRLPPGGHTRETIRASLHDILAHIRAAATLPWNADELRFMTGTAPYMAEWLKDGEGDRLLAEFKAELDRLGAPVEQTAPNWRAKWGLAG